MASTWVYLIRHGEVEQAAEGRFFGHTDVALSTTGLLQVEALARQLALEPIEAVYASDLARARQSAAPLAGRLGLAPIVVPALREMAMGRWEGLTFREIRERGRTLARWLANSRRLPRRRASRFRARVRPGALDRHAGGRIAVVAPAARTA
jgi:broad specificity phosphatase PhoE